MRLRAKFEREPRAPAKEAAASTEKKPELCAGARNLAMAKLAQRLIERGVIRDYSHAAQLLKVSQPRMTHLMSLLLLAPAIQERLLLRGEDIPDKQLRRIARIDDWDEQEAEVLDLAHRPEIDPPGGIRVG